jgi:membrane protein DedA with SNARE-associated domain
MSYTSLMPFQPDQMCPSQLAALWVGAWSTGGYYAGDHIEEIAKGVSKYAVAAAGVTVLLIVAYVWRRRRKRLGTVSK